MACVIYRLADWVAVPIDTVVQSLGPSAPVIFFGEIHERSWVVECEVAILKAAVERGAKFLGLEMFNYEQQSMIDSWVNGLIGWRELIDRYTGGGEGFDLEKYRPLLVAARNLGVKIVGVMPPRRYAAQVARRGLGFVDGVKGSPVKAGEIKVPSDYRWALMELFPRTGPMAKLSRERLAMAQAYKDSVIARITANAVRRYGLGMVVAGWAHMEVPGSAPTRFSEETGLRYVVIGAREEGLVKPWSLASFLAMSADTLQHS